jgi:hypothetical protein
VRPLVDGQGLRRGEVPLAGVAPHSRNFVAWTRAQQLFKIGFLMIFIGLIFNDRAQLIAIY